MTAHNSSRLHAYEQRIAAAVKESRSSEKEQYLKLVADIWLKRLVGYFRLNSPVYIQTGRVANVMYRLGHKDEKYLYAKTNVSGCHMYVADVHMLLIDPNSDEWDDSRMAAVLIHELAHAECHDRGFAKQEWYGHGKEWETVIERVKMDFAEDWTSFYEDVIEKNGETICKGYGERVYGEMLRRRALWDSMTYEEKNSIRIYGIRCLGRKGTEVQMRLRAAVSNYNDKKEWYPRNWALRRRVWDANTVDWWASAKTKEYLGIN